MQSLDRYQAFYVAARFENFSRAADELMVSQSAVSQAVRQLEDHLGTQLFLRNGRKVSLSPDGRFLRDQLAPVFERLERTERQLMEERDPEQGRLVIGASDTLCRHYLLESFERFHTAYPRVRLEIINAPSPEIAQRVRDHQIDVGFVHGLSHDFADLNVRSLRSIKEVFFARSGSTPSEMTREELQSLPFVGLTKRSATRKLLDEFFQADVSGWKPSVEVISIDLMIDLVRSGFGISYTHRDLILSQDFTIIETDIELAPREILRIQPQTRYSSKALEQFDDFLKRV